MIDNKMPFGKHKGECIRDLPEDYLKWLLTIDLREPLLSAVHAAWTWRVAELEAMRQQQEQRENAQRDQEETRQREKSRRARPSDALHDPHVAEMAQRIVKSGLRQLAIAHHPDRQGGDTKTMQIVNVAASALREILEVSAR